jgi:hypothetical protein
MTPFSHMQHPQGLQQLPAALHCTCSPRRACLPPAAKGRLQFSSKLIARPDQGDLWEVRGLHFAGEAVLRCTAAGEAVLRCTTAPAARPQEQQ